MIFLKSTISIIWSMILIEIKDKEKIYIKSKILKKLDKTLIIDRDNLNQKEFQNKIITISKTNKDLIKSQNLIDVRTPSFLNVKINLKKNNLLNLISDLKRLI